MILRPYQQESVDAIYSWFKHRKGNPLIVIPTGGGKSLILAEFVRGLIEAYPTIRIVVMTHVRELIAQNYATMLRLWPEAPAGIYSAGIGRREHDAKVLFAGIQSVHDKTALIGWTDLLIVDEAHLIPSRRLGMYRTFVADMLSVNPDSRVLGLTATPFRTDSGSLYKGPDRLFHGIAYSADIRDLIADGYLSNVSSKSTDAEIDTDGIRKQAGDFALKALSDRATEGDNVANAVSEIISRGQDRKAWLIFCVSVEHAKKVCDCFRERGIECESIFGDTPTAKRDELIDRYKAKNLRVLVSVGVLTTGFDAPHVDLIALLRPTMSASLYVQMVGRGLRIAEGKSNCLVLDFGGNVERHGPINEVSIREVSDEPGSGSAPVKACPECRELVAIQCKVCVDCGHVFVDVRELPPHADRPADVELIAPKRAVIEEWKVQRVDYKEHQKPGKPRPVLRVTYSCGFKQWANEWICFEHDGIAGRKAAQWWLKHGGKEPIPATVQEALCRAVDCAEVSSPIRLKVDARGDFPEIRAKVFREPGLDDDDDEDESEPACDIGDEEVPF